VKRVTSALGVHHCESCEERARRMNSWVTFRGRDSYGARDGSASSGT
jgi:hypothetical protein